MHSFVVLIHSPKYLNIMKKFLLLTTLLFAMQFGLKAQNVTFNNTTSNYFIGALHASPGSSCLSIVPSSFYYDIPNNFVHTTSGIVDENGNTITIPNIVGISFQLYPSGPIFACSFCTGASVTASGVKVVISGGTTVTVVWQFIGGNLTISFL